MHAAAYSSAREGATEDGTALHHTRSTESTRGISEYVAPCPLGNELEREASLEDRLGAASPLDNWGSVDNDLTPGHPPSSRKSLRGINEFAAPEPLHPESDQTYERQLSDQTEKQSSTSRLLRKPFLDDISEILLWFIVFSIFGALARIGVTALDGYPGQVISALVWVQFIGCLIMGLLSESKDFFVFRSGTNLQLFVGLSTGFCGSFTTFSGWMRECFLAMANAAPESPRPRGYAVLGLIDAVIVTVCMSIAGLRFGAHVSIFLRHLWTTDFKKPDAVQETPKRPFGFGLVGGRRTLPLLHILALFLGVGCWVGVILMSVFIARWRGKVLFALVFGPVGTISRWLLSRYLNPLFPSFPLGTFTANIIGTALLGIFAVIQQHVESRTSCQILQGLMDGYCGCLTTVSTFVLELQTLRRKHSWQYASASVVCGVLIMCLTIGVDHWRFGPYDQVSC
ncbi:CrcB-like protein-domain-containing protein [Limtongia smithiae]|uniref:CrcB-like protein-domain-containing protein n=1 Tax=Limtongia smithiae TaxID=1125753 RepID=UPI0034CFDDE3